MAAKAGNKAEEMKQGNMAQYEAKQALIRRKELERERERKEKNRLKEEQY